MLKSRVGYSEENNSSAAGKEIAKKASDGVRKPKVGFLYTSTKYNQKHVLEGVRSVLKNTPIIGATSGGGIIVPDGIINNENGFGGMLVLDDDYLCVGVSGSERGKNPRETGKKIALDALEKAGKDYAPAYCYMVSSSKDEEEYIKGIQDIVGDVTIFGGGASDNNFEKNTSVLCNDKVYSDGVAIAFIYTDKQIDTIFKSDYEVGDNVGLITEVSDNRSIVSINNAPALEEYSKWINKSVDNIKEGNIEQDSILRPFGVKNILGDITVIRHPLQINGDNSVLLSNKIVSNTCLMSMITTEDKLVESSHDTVEKVKAKLETAGAYLLLYDVSLRNTINDRMIEVYKSVKKASNGVPFIMAFSSCEYGSVNHSGTLCGDLMMSFTGFEK